MGNSGGNLGLSMERVRNELLGRWRWLSVNRTKSPKMTPEICESSELQHGCYGHRLEHDEWLLHAQTTFFTCAVSTAHRTIRLDGYPPASLSLLRPGCIAHQGLAP